MHCFCAWLYREIALRKASLEMELGQERQTIPGWRLRMTLSILGIVVLMFIAGIAAVGSVHQLIWMRTRP
jgi:hypothetical protein